MYTKNIKENLVDGSPTFSNKLSYYENAPDLIIDIWNSSLGVDKEFYYQVQYVQLKRVLSDRLPQLNLLQFQTPAVASELQFQTQVHVSQPSYSTL